MDVNEVLARLRDKATELGGEGALAAEAGVSQQFVNMVFHRQRKPTAKLLDTVNIELVTEYREKEAGSA